MKKKNTNPNQPSLLKTLQTYVMVGLQEFWQNLKGRKTLAIGMTAALATIPTVFVACVPKDTTPPEAPDASGNEKPKPQEPTTPNPGEQEKPTNPSQPENPNPEKPGPEEPENPNPEQPTNPIESISDLTDEQKQLLTNYIDENYKDQILRKLLITNSSKVDTIAYDFDTNTNKINVLFKHETQDLDMYFAAELGATINLDKVVKALGSEKEVEEGDLSIDIKSTKKSSTFKIYKEENEYSEKAPEVYSNLLAAEDKVDNTDEQTIYSVKPLGDTYGGQVTEILGTGMWPAFQITTLTIKDGKYYLNSVQFVTKDYNKTAATQDINYVFEEHVDYSFGSENTIFAKSNENEIVGVNLNDRTYEIAYIENTPFLEQ